MIKVVGQLRENENNPRTMLPTIPRTCSIGRRGEEGKREEGEGGALWAEGTEEQEGKGEPEGTRSNATRDERGTGDQPIAKHTVNKRAQHEVIRKK